MEKRMLMKILYRGINKREEFYQKKIRGRRVGGGG